jgi:hypothetical protein
MKVLLAAAVLVALITPALAMTDEDLEGIISAEKESRNLVPKTKKPVPRAKALVLRANSKDDVPTCSAMFEASKLLQKADDLYAKAKEFGGDIRDLGRRQYWLEVTAKSGHCEHDSQFLEYTVPALEKKSRNVVPATNKPMPEARSLVVKANALLKGDPTCAQMLEASNVLKEANKLYDAADDGIGEHADTIKFRPCWLKVVSDSGKCRKES